MICKSVEEFIIEYLEKHNIENIDFIDDKMYEDLVDYIDKNISSELLKSKGDLYCYGKGTIQNYSKAVYYYKEAEKLNNNDAGFEVSRLEFCERIIANYIKQAENNNIEKQLLLAQYYYEGKLIEKNLQKALFWAKKANENGVEDAKSLIEDIEKEIEISQNKNKIHLSKRKDVFISWNHLDINIKNEIYQTLEQNGLFTVWESDGDGVGEINEVISDAIKQSKVYLIILTKNSLKSKWIEKELKQIYEVCDGEKTNYKIIPLIMEDRVIKKIKKLDNSSLFKKLLSQASQFTNKKKINYENLIRVINESIEKTIIKDYKTKATDKNKNFIGTINPITESKLKYLKYIPSLYNFKKHYVERVVYNNNKNYVEEILSNKFALVYGNKGTGKTLYFKNILINHFINNRYIIYISCIEAINYLHLDFLDIINKVAFTKLFSKDYQISRKGVERIFDNENEIIILIDGLDKIDEEEKIVLLNKIKEINYIYDNIKWLFNSRYKGDNKILEKILNYPIMLYELRDFDENENDRFINNVILKHREQIYNEKNITVGNYDKKLFLDIIKFVGIDKNPYLMSNLMTLSLFESPSVLKPYEMLLFSIELLLTNYNEEEKFDVDYEGIYIYNLLEYISYKLIIQENREIKTLIEEYLLNNNIENIENKTTLIKKVLIQKNIFTEDTNKFVYDFLKTFFSTNYIFKQLYKLCVDDNNKYFDYINDKINKEYINEIMIKNKYSWDINDIIINIVMKLDYEIYKLKGMNIKNDTDEIKDLSLKLLNDIIDIVLKSETKGNIKNVLKEMILGNKLYYSKYLTIEE